MVSKWKELRLDEVTELIVDCPHSTPKWTDEGIVVLRSNNIKNGRLDVSSPSYTDQDGYEKRVKRAVPQAGDLVLTREAPMGEVCQIPEGLKCCLGQRMVLIRVKEVVVDSKYLLYTLQSPYLQYQISWNEGTGTTVSNIRIPNIKAFQIPTPPIAEQKAIAHILGKLDDKIELNRQINETLEAMAQALFKSWFVDFDPVIDNALLAGKAIPEPLKERAELRQAQLDSGKANTDSEINDLFPSEFEFTEELGWIPKGWRVRPLPELMDFLEGPGIRNWQYTEEEDGINFINIRCIQSGDINLKTANKITREEAFGKYKHFQLEVDDIIMSASGTLGRYAFVRQEHLPLSLNTSVIRFRPINGVSTLYYIAGYIDTKLQWELETRASGSVQRNFGPMHLKKITMFVPDINVLEEHARLSSEIFNKRRNNLEQIDTLIQLRDTLLPKLMSGELRIADAEKLVENI